MKRDRWIDDAIFASFKTVFPPYQNAGMVIMVIMCNGTPFTQASIKKSAYNRIQTQARKREEMIMWILVK